MKKTAFVFIWLLFSPIFISNTVKEKQPAYNSAISNPKIQVAILLDTSGSMGGLINQAKSQLWKIVNKLSKARFNNQIPKIEVALLHYGNDGLNAKEGYIKILQPFTINLDAVSADLFKLTTNGGNEYCGAAIKTAINQLKWSDSQNDIKLIFICGNEPFTQGSVSYESTCKNALNKGIVVNSIYCGSRQQGINTKWQAPAFITGGTFSVIEQNRATTYIKTPYDSAIASLNTKLNSTYVPYGKAGRLKVEEMEKQDKNAKSISEANGVLRASYKAGAADAAYNWDLLNALANNLITLEEIKQENLPKSLQNKTKAELKKTLQDYTEKRKKIKAEIKLKMQQRSKYITQNVKKSNKPSLNNSITNAVERVAKEKNYTFVQ